MEEGSNLPDVSSKRRVAFPPQTDYPQPHPPVWQWPPAGGEEGKVSPFVLEAKVEKSRRLFFSPQ